MRAARSVSPGRGRCSFSLLDQVERPLLLLAADVGGRLEVQDRGRPLAEQRPLVDRRQVARAPARRAALGHAFRLRHHAVRRQVLARRCRGRRSPTTRGRVAHQRAAGVQLVHRRGVDRAECTSTPRRKQMSSTHVGEVRHQVADPHAALAVLLELARARQQAACRPW